MSKKYYYTCPIKALYMMKEFEIDIYKDVEILSSMNLTTGKYIKKPGGKKVFEKVYIDEIIENFGIREALTMDGKIYVATKSQKIFKFKKSDLIKNGFGSIAFYNQISQKNSVSEIIYRDGKQFFMPEVEND